MFDLCKGEQAFMATSFYNPLQLYSFSNTSQSDQDSLSVFFPMFYLFYVKIFSTNLDV